MGIEPTYAAWEAAVLPLNYARLIFLYQRLMRTPKNHLALFWLYLARHSEPMHGQPSGGGIWRGNRLVSTPANGEQGLSLAEEIVRSAANYYGWPDLKSRPLAGAIRSAPIFLGVR